MQWTTSLFSALSATGKFSEGEFSEGELTELIEQEKKKNKVDGAGD